MRLSLRGCMDPALFLCGPGRGAITRASFARIKKRDSHNWKPRYPETTDAGSPTVGERGGESTVPSPNVLAPSMTDGVHGGCDPNHKKLHEPACGGMGGSWHAETTERHVDFSQGTHAARERTLLERGCVLAHRLW